VRRGADRSPKAHGSIFYDRHEEILARADGRGKRAGGERKSFISGAVSDE